MDEYWYSSEEGLRLYSRIYPGPGAGAPVLVCLHGLTRNSRDFEELAPHLAARYRVIVPDVRGRGLSARDPNPANYQIPVYLRDLARLLTGLGATRIAIVGTSMGGLMAMVLAAMQPQLLSRIVLNDIGPEVDPAGLERIKTYAGRSAPVTTIAQAAAQQQRIFGPAWPGLSSERWEELAQRSYRADAAGQLVSDADPQIGEVVRRSPAAAQDLWPLWAQLQYLPILALRGALSDILSAATLERMQRDMPLVQTVTVPERGHAPLLDEPVALAAIDAFLAGRD